MKFEASDIPGVFHIAATPHVDDRGFFGRIFCPEEFQKAGIDFTSTQINLSRNTSKHTLRGMHWQDAPFAEAKVVRCVRGRIYDVVADIRPGSPTFRKWQGFELSAERADALFIPEGCAHGFLTLEAECDVLYQMGRIYEPGQARGFRYDDPAFQIEWPDLPSVIGKSDLDWPSFIRAAS
jgi:dTDP-4-dehydrorhamnose 3,5-epimerase